MLMLKVTFIFLMMTILGCGSSSVVKYTDWQPKFDLFKYFQGTTVASGVFFGRSGAVETSFQLTLKGELKESEQLLLKESLVYRNGDKTEREFLITRVAPEKYTVSCPDFVGEGTIETAGNAAHWQYKLRQDVGGRLLTLRFDDWMYLQPDQTILNRAYAYWYGIFVGEVFMSARKE